MLYNLNVGFSVRIDFHFENMILFVLFHLFYFIIIPILPYLLASTFIHIPYTKTLKLKPET
jgi:hypothetical protein